jgi:superfamily II DNA or RNA helicase
MKPPTVKVQLGNRWAVFDCDPDVQVRLKKFFRYSVPGAQFSEAYRCGSWDGFQNMLQRGRVATGLFLEQQETLGKKFQLILTDERRSPAFKDVTSIRQLRPYQENALVAMISASTCGGLILSGTGTGKTALAAAFFARLQGQALFVCDELALLSQSRAALAKDLGEEVGIVGSGRFELQRVTCATIQTLHKRRHTSVFRKWFRTLEVVIVDEVHVAINKRNADVIQQIAAKAVFGLTATLEVEKPHVHLPAVAMCGPVVFEYPISQGVEDGYLSDGVIYRVEFYDPLTGMAPAYPTLVDGKKVWIKAGSQAAEYRRRVCLNKSRNDCVEGIVREGLRCGRKIVVLVDWKVHLRMLDNRFSDVKHRSLSGEIKPAARLEAMREMDAGELDLILASKVFAKGVDIQSVNLILDCCGLPSRNNAIQRYGRGVRKNQKEKVLFYVDIFDVGNRFEAAGRSRLKALQELGSPIIHEQWKNDAKAVLKAMEEINGPDIPS